MQLFTIGLYELKLDGTRKVDGDGKHIRTYSNDDIMMGGYLFRSCSSLLLVFFILLLIFTQNIFASLRQILAHIYIGLCAALMNRALAVLPSCRGGDGGGGEPFCRITLTAEPGEHDNTHANNMQYMLIASRHTFDDERDEFAGFLEQTHVRVAR